jgi:hypothetical protein
MTDQSFDSSDQFTRLSVPSGPAPEVTMPMDASEQHSTESFEISTQIEFIDLSSWTKFSHGDEANVYKNEEGTRVTKVFKQSYFPRHFERFQIMLTELKEILEEQGIADTTSYPEIKVVLTQNGYGLQMDFIPGDSIGKLTYEVLKYVEGSSKKEREEIEVASILNKRAIKLILDANEVTKKHFGYAAADIGSVGLWNDDFYIHNILVVGKPPTTTQEAKDATLVYFDPLTMQSIAAVVDKAEGIGKVRAALSEYPENSYTEKILSLLENDPRIPWNQLCNDENISHEEVINFISTMILASMWPNASIKGFYIPNPSWLENPSQTPSFLQKTMTALGFREKSLATIDIEHKDFSISFKVPWSIVLDDKDRIRSVFSIGPELKPFLSQAIIGSQ